MGSQQPKKPTVFYTCGNDFVSCGENIGVYKLELS